MVNDAVNHPSHYCGAIETIDFIRDKLTPDQFVGYCLGNVMKYVSRYRDKGGKQDLEKAAVYLGWAVRWYQDGRETPEESGPTVTPDAVVAVDFDGCLCTNAWPEIGEPNNPIIDKLIQHRRHGGKVILWTCREGVMLEKARIWCAMQGLEFDAINDNVPERKDLFQNNCRKIGADQYWDDKAVVVRAVANDKQ
jgi:hypothetical protein